VTVVTKPVVKYKTTYKTKVVAPDLPGGAFLPSKHAALSMTSFALPDNTIACEISGGSVRCDVDSALQSWNPPAKPGTCTASWGSGIVLTDGAKTPPQFACGGTSVLSLNAPEIAYGDDDKVGPITCQVRTGVVNCFAKNPVLSASGDFGFILSLTGYYLY